MVFGAYVLLVEERMQRSVVYARDNKVKTLLVDPYVWDVNEMTKQESCMGFGLVS